MSQIKKVLYEIIIVIYLVTLSEGAYISFNKHAIRPRDKYAIIDHENNKITIKIIVHIDKSLYNNYAERYGRKSSEIIKKITRNTMEDVKKNFQHYSLGRNVDLEVRAIKFLKNITKIVTANPNGSEYLKSYCNWQAGMKNINKDIWYSVLLTGLDLYYIKDGSKILLSEGRGYRNSVCNVNKSCTVVEGTSTNLVHVITHELGHSLGLHHDGAPDNTCSPRGFVMAKSFKKNAVINSWSHCSNEKLDKFLRTQMASCLKKT